MKLVSNQINPHFNLPDSLHAIGSLLFGTRQKKLDPHFKKVFQTENILFTNTARSALGLIADTVKPDTNKRIGMPAFICAVVATPFLSRGYEIQWIDTDENGLIDMEDLKRKADNISLLVVPHIFGQLAPLKEIMPLAKEKNIFVVEDGAHLIRQFLPHFKSIADAQILSFGREKVISCVAGGALIWPDNSPYTDAFATLGKTIARPRLGWTLRHALQPFIFALSLPWWHQGGKILPWLALKLKLLPLAVTPQEKSGAEDIAITKMSVVQKRILARQLKLWDNRTIHAQAMALSWQEALAYNFPTADMIIPPLAFRFLIKLKSPQEKKEILYNLAQQKAPFHLDDWQGVPISPSGINYQTFGYRPGYCVGAEYFARTYLTFPTNQRTGKADIKRFAKYTQAA